MSIKIKSDREIALIRDACRLAAEILERSAELAKPGVTTDEILPTAGADEALDLTARAFLRDDSVAVVAAPGIAAPISPGDRLRPLPCARSTSAFTGPLPVATL